MATGKIQLNGIQFEPLTLNFTPLACSGTITGIPNIYISTDKKFLWISGSRITISNYNRSGANPGIIASTNIIPSDNITTYCGIRFDNTTIRPETAYFSLDTLGRMSFKTSESYTNASGNPLHLMVNSCIVPIN